MALRDRLEAVEADITTLSVDAIVNAANAALTPGGGVDGAIRRKAGREIDDELAQIGHLDEGDAVITSGYLLPCAYVIHTVAPIWAGGAARAEKEKRLTLCYQNALALTDANAIRSIAFPCLGIGAYRWPADIATKLAFDAVAAHLRQCEVHTLISFCCFSRNDRERYADLIAALRD